MVKYSLDKQARFIIEDYNKAKVFSSFLPAISGKFGIPLWCFYANRAQGICSFGIKDRDHSILEFSPANKAHQQVFQKGFRTFIKIDSRFHEPFTLPQDNNIKQIMRVDPSFFEIEEDNKRLGLNIKVTYFTLPSEDFASLVRVVEIENNSRKARNLEILDGLTYIVPFGAQHVFLKDLSRTLEAWMDSCLKDGIAFYRLRVFPKDVSHTIHIQDANFYFSCLFDGRNKINFLKSIADPSCVFKDDTGFYYPHNFICPKFKYPEEQILSGKTPCALSFLKKRLWPKSRLTFFGFAGSTDEEKKIFKFIRGLSEEFINNKFQENLSLIERIEHKSFMRSSESKLDYYMQQTFLDNVLRGGLPQDFRDGGHSSVHYLYSRKHGDLERDYNKFKFENNFLSSGEGNFRDVNQNRRCDIYFNPSLGRQSLHLFFNLQRLDSYNPLVVKPYKFIFLDKEEFINSFKDILPGYVAEDSWSMCSGYFSLGDFIHFLKKKGISPKLWDACASRVISRASKEEEASFGEGFWIDHWVYNLDLIESYLSVFPDKEEELLFEESYFFYDDFCKVNPRSKRIGLWKGRVMHHNFLQFDGNKPHLLNSRRLLRHRLRIKDTDQVFYTNIVTKIMVTILNKLSTLDPFGLGIEMEAGKPGWCDALNGLPAVFGSSLPEVFELKRLCLFLNSRIRKYADKVIKLPEEIYVFFKNLESLLDEHLGGSRDNLYFWDKSNILKEKYREDVFWGITGNISEISLGEIGRFLIKAVEKIDRGLSSVDYSKGVPAYFINELIDYKTGPDGEVIPLKFKQRSLPLFLEGFVRAFRLFDKEKIKQMHAFVKRSPLYDKKLKMYKLNVSLKNEPFEIGRIRVFNPGWLENESVWLHMEYKYLLELLRAGLYDEFYKEFYNCFICYQDPAVYGRSILENSSFIVSSAYLDKKDWGRGFVARLSGSTAEAVNIFILMCVGLEPFFLEGGDLFLELKPALRGGFFTKRSHTVSVFVDSQKKQFTLPDNSFCFKFLGDILVVYHNPGRLDTYADKAKIVRVKIKYKEGREFIISSPKIPPPHSLRIRNREAEVIEAFIE